jgi:glycosyltransferase involved in cell wall biosynthesis
VTQLPARVGVISTSYPRWPGDAAGGFVAEHVRALRAAGASVEVVCAGDGAERVEHGVFRVAAAPGLFYDGGAPDALEAGARLRDAAAFSARLAARAVVRSRRWDAVVAHWLAPSAVAALPTRGPLLAIAHGGDVHLLLRLGALTPVVAGLAARRARVAFVCEDLRARAIAALPARLAAWLDERSIVQPMGVDLARFAAIDAPPAPPPPSPAARATIAVLARLVPIKGVDVVIDAMAAVDAPARLVIAGDGPSAELLAARAARMSARTGQPIELVGGVGADARDRLLATASVVVVPSRPAGERVEGAPVAAIEALAAGRPVIAAATGGLAELPAPVRLVAPDDAMALGRAITDVLRAPPPAEVCRAAARSRGWAEVAERLADHWLAAQRVTHEARK